MYLKREIVSILSKSSFNVVLLWDRRLMLFICSLLYRVVHLVEENLLLT